MQQSTEFLQKNLSLTPRYETQREIQVKIFWSTLRYVTQRGVDTSSQIYRNREIETKVENILKS
jgi:hypothetical protein